GQLALEPPFDRLTALRRIHAANRPFGLQQEALDLAVARYLGAHPDTPQPASLPDEVAGLDTDAIQARAAALRAELDELEAIAKDDPEFDVHRYFEVPFEFAIARDLLDRATSGVFAAATGPLHEYLTALGAVGYDDDPSMVDLEDVDLEADASRAAIEEALADDDEL
ncbi:MAG: hypothetical protein KC656_32830, partial [Myxococcales bacterium]|nr:hypothetical protein [Myxococcales bacterium]